VLNQIYKYLFLQGSSDEEGKKRREFALAPPQLTPETGLVL
jgi:hypothetical protein